MNKYIAKGNLTRDPELRNTPNGDSVVGFGLAINKKWKNKDGDYVEQVVYPNFDVWGASGENFAKYVKKGDAVLVEAEYTQNSKEVDGEKKTFHGFRVLTWEFAGNSKNGNGNKAEEKDEDAFDNSPPKKAETPKRGRPAKVAPPVVEEDDSDTIPF